MGFDLNLSADQRQILDAADAMLAQAYPLGRLRAREADTLQPLGDFGTFLLSMPESEGGAGFSVVEEALLHTLLGRHLVTTRALATALAARVARHAGHLDLAAALAALERPACVALRSGAGILLVDPVPGSIAVVFEGRGLTLVDPGEARAVTGLGSSVAAAQALGEGAVIAATRDGAVLALADLLVSSQLLGVAEGARDLAVAYAGVRRQFGKPIGAFQAVKHHAADMAIGAEMLSAQRDMAAVALANGQEDAPFQVAALRRLAGRVALANARTCVQLHGGMGFSAEADAHHFVKQAHVLSRLGEAALLLDLPSPMAPVHRAGERT